jgi:hypothetical protein
MSVECIDLDTLERFSAGNGTPTDTVTSLHAYVSVTNMRRSFARSYEMEALKDHTKYDPKHVYLFFYMHQAGAT